LAVRHSLSAPTWLNPTVIAPPPVLFALSEQPVNTAMKSTAIQAGILVIRIYSPFIQ
jgi:hypothetical protein